MLELVVPVVCTEKSSVKTILAGSVLREGVLSTAENG